ncbi:MAG: hypothetical protein WCP69_08325 [Bacteroidota bacterium]
MKILKQVFFITLSFIGFASCSSNVHKKIEPAIDKGKIIENVVCKKNIETNYALYLPSAYDSANKYPIIIAFDAHGDGLKPVTLFKDQAEKFGYIVVGSNNSKNGLSWESTNAIYNSMISDIKERFSINNSRIYTAGFSGGSRVASSIAILNGGIAGVVGFSAGFPNLNQPITNKFDFLGVVGSSDFNFNEMSQLDKTLQTNGFKHYLKVFDGKHEWPQPEVIPDVFYWLEFCAYRKNLSSINQSVISEFEKNSKSEIELFKSKKDLFGKYLCYLKCINFLEGVSNTDVYKAKVAELEKSTTIQNELKQIEADGQKEQKLQAFYADAMVKKEIKWWNSEVAKINGIIQKNKTNREGFLHQRVLSYLSMCGYSYSNNSLRSGQLDQAQHFISIYAIIDPENSDPPYFQAQLFALKNDSLNAIKSLEKAITLGFNDVNKLQNDTSFSKLHSLTEFKNLVNKMNIKQ